MEDRVSVYWRAVSAEIDREVSSWELDSIPEVPVEFEDALATGLQHKFVPPEIDASDIKCDELSPEEKDRVRLAPVQYVFPREKTEIKPPAEDGGVCLCRGEGVC